jgi:ABC-type uncharacterized transport system auxiliary subunit
MRKSTITALIGFTALGGCAQVRYPSFYTLNLPNPVPAARDSGPIPETVAVPEFRAPPYLRQGPIAYRPESQQIAFYDYHQRVEDPRQTVTATMVRLLTPVFESVELYDGRTGAEFLLSGSLDRLDEIDSERSVSVEIEISAKLQNVKTSSVMWSGRSYKASPVNQRSLPGIVAEMSRDLNEAAIELASSMWSQIPQGSLRTNND